ncbi:MAG TPA: hypothetical protein VGH74_22670, partial [Planctomycetaceae bacterium]
TKYAKDTKTKYAKGISATGRLSWEDETIDRKIQDRRIDSFFCPEFFCHSRSAFDSFSFVSFAYFVVSPS